MRKLTQRTEAVVNLRALEHNVKNIRARLGSGVEIMAVLKGDGYGHGEKGIYPTLKSWKARPCGTLAAPSRSFSSATPATVSLRT